MAITKLGKEVLLKSASITGVVMGGIRANNLSDDEKKH